MRRHFLGAVGLAVVILGLVAAPAAAATGDRLSGDRRISISGGVVVAQGETVNGPVVSFDGPVTIDGVVTDDVFVGRGNLRVNGRVTGDVLVLDGDATVTGHVGGDVISIGGRVIVQSGPHVGGDVVSRRDPRVASGTVQGDVKHLNLSSIFGGFLIAFLIFLWYTVTVSVATLGLLFVLLFPPRCRCGGRRQPAGLALAWLGGARWHLGADHRRCRARNNRRHSPRDRDALRANRSQPPRLRHGLALARSNDGQGTKHRGAHRQRSSLASASCRRGSSASRHRVHRVVRRLPVRLGSTYRSRHGGRATPPRQSTTGKCSRANRPPPRSPRRNAPEV